MRQNLLARLRAGQDRFPGIVGFGQTVLPQLERAMLAGHDSILLGERGQGKTRLIRTLTVLLDEWTPGRRPAARSTTTRTRRSARGACGWPPNWATTCRSPGGTASERYGEKLATPDTSVGDLIGDIDPVKVAEGRTLGDPETIHFGLVPRTNRGIFCLNELPDLAERIQVALLNVLEERDIGVRGYSLRLPLDLVLVASANPEDYTNRGRIITPLKDRFGAEIRTHYPLTLDDELALIEQEALLSWDGRRPGRDPARAPGRGHRPVHPAGPGLPGGGLPVRRVGPVRDRGGRGGGRLGGPAGRDHRRGAAGGPGLRPARRSSARLRGKVEFEVSEEGREAEVLEHLLRRAIAETFRVPAGQRRPDRPAGHVRGRRLGRDRRPDPGGPCCCTGSARCPGWPRSWSGSAWTGGESFGEAAAALEFALEGLYLMRRLSKDVIDGSAVYRT